MLVAFCLLAFPRGSPSELTKGCQCYWPAVAKPVRGVTVFSSSSAEESQGADVPCGSGGTRDFVGFVDCVCLTWLLSTHLFSALSAGRVVASEWHRWNRSQVG